MDSANSFDLSCDLRWKDDSTLLNIKAKEIYKTLICNFFVIEPKKAYFRWLVVLQKVPFKSIFHEVEICTICTSPKSVKCIFCPVFLLKRYRNYFEVIL